MPTTLAEQPWSGAYGKSGIGKGAPRNTTERKIGFQHWRSTIATDQQGPVTIEPAEAKTENGSSWVKHTVKLASSPAAPVSPSRGN
jgi:hypothetical protein